MGRPNTNPVEQPPFFWFPGASPSGTFPVVGLQGVGHGGRLPLVWMLALIWVLAHFWVLLIRAY